ncbi:hypothetical protein SAMN02745121_05916 [Nannocystis exedens]|uniref:Uncharacterized protein n=1 Tax=Nannocystis exedens TaxID=54 RepID=A0A1I2E4U4_9BACT|nr:hypothetical protein [Nannocystis exedens]PCC69273.1 hypothetical protein NAEX_02295 [Nannocystis exedens]SFE87669.1 hypothetical protein SAMN02745121_05916 [Nannocystis exedens]
MREGLHEDARAAARGAAEALLAAVHALAFAQARSMAILTWDPYDVADVIATMDAIGTELIALADGVSDAALERLQRALESG